MERAIYTDIESSIVIGSILIVFLLIAIVLVVILKKKKTNVVRITIDENFINQLINAFGGKENINNIFVENTKLNVNVIDLEKTDLDKVKELANSGVFVSGNTIKTLFKYDSAILKREIDKLGE